MNRCGGYRSRACSPIRDLSNPVEAEFNRCWSTSNAPNGLCQALERCVEQQQVDCGRPGMRSRPHSAPPTYSCSGSPTSSRSKDPCRAGSPPYGNQCGSSSSNDATMPNGTCGGGHHTTPHWAPHCKSKHYTRNPRTL